MNTRSQQLMFHVSYWYALVFDVVVCQSVVRPMLSTDGGHRNLLITILVRCDDNTCGVTLKSNWRRTNFYRSDDSLVY